MKIQFYTVKEVAARYNVSTYYLKKKAAENGINIRGRFVWPKQIEEIIKIFGNVE